MTQKDTITSEQPDMAREQAEDIAYTINHAIVCTATDFIDPVVQKWTQDKWGKKFSIGCGHDHSKDGHHHHDHSHDHNHEHHHHHHDHDHHPKASLLKLSVAELTGDFAAVPITVGAQRFTPSLMRGLGAALEPVFGPVFNLGIKMGNNRWAREHGLEADSAEAKEHGKKLYNYEMHHLPQAAIWTASSVAVNLAMQKAQGSSVPLSVMLDGKARGVLISTALVVGARGLVPHAAKRWDEKTRDELFLPATKTVSRWFGVDEKAVDSMVAKHAKLHKEKWQERVEEEKSKPSPAHSGRGRLQ